MQRIIDRLPVDEDYKKFNELTSYNERVKFLDEQNISLGTNYGHSGLGLEIDITPHNPEENEILNDALLKEIEKYHPGYSFKYMEKTLLERLQYVDPYFYLEALANELKDIELKLITKGIEKSYKEYIKGKKREFYKRGGLDDIIGYEVFRYAAFVKRLINENNPIEKFKKMENSDKDKLTMKQQIFLLKKLGVFDLEVFKDFTVQKLGILFAHILNRNEKNVEDTIRERFSKTIFTEKDNKKILTLLQELGLAKV